jgi:hypothetical protein
MPNGMRISIRFEKCRAGHGQAIKINNEEEPIGVRPLMIFVAVGPDNHRESRCPAAFPPRSGEGATNGKALPFIYTCTVLGAGSPKTLGAKLIITVRD